MVVRNKLVPGVRKTTLGETAPQKTPSSYSLPENYPHTISYTGSPRVVIANEMKSNELIRWCLQHKSNLSLPDTDSTSTIFLTLVRSRTFQCNRSFKSPCKNRKGLSFIQNKTGWNFSYNHIQWVQCKS